MTGPVIFSDETARAQLQEHGEVVTFRTSYRTTGTTWWRKSRTGVKQGNCRITLLKSDVAMSETNIFDAFVEYSGFDSVSEWQTRIQELNDDVESGHLYYVTPL